MDNKKENPLLYGTSGAGSVWSDFRNNDEFLESILNKIKQSALKENKSTQDKLKNKD